MKTIQDPPGLRLFTSGEPFTEEDDKIFQEHIAQLKQKKLNGHHLNGKKVKKARKRKLSSH